MAASTSWSTRSAIPPPLEMAISLARDAGTVSGIGGLRRPRRDALGLAWLKGLTLRLGLANVIAHVDRVLALIEAGRSTPLRSSPTT